MTLFVLPDQETLLLGELRLYAPAQVNRSGWTGSRKVVGMPGAELWRGKALLADIATEAEERPWRAWLFGLRGPQNWFKWPLPCNTHPGSRPTVASGAGDAYTLPLAGLSPSITILLAGQFMTVPLPSGRNRAVCLINNLTADGGGNATATFEPALTEAPTAGTTVETVNPFVPMSLVEQEQGFSADQGVSGASFDVEEYR